MINEANITGNFLINHWEWFTGFAISLVGVLISYLAYKQADQASSNTNQLIKDKYEEALKLVGQISNNKIEERLIEAAISEYSRKGEVKTFLLNEFNRLKPKGWTENQFEAIYKTIGMRVKNREFKQPLFNLK